MATTTTGYSGTPLARKLGLHDGCRLHVDGAPPEYAHWLEPLPQGLSFVPAANAATDIVHVFFTLREDLAARLPQLRKALRPDAVLWVSWPKKSSKLPSTVTEDVVREVALPLGFVDVKVCAVSDVWSGLKLVVRKALR